jgi:O-antigen/teichoic acid export membrane protein
MQITRKDVGWSFMAAFFKVASSIILLPLILKMMPVEEVGLWTIFVSVTFIVNLFDFGFSTSFSRNISYIFSGVHELKTNGVSADHDPESVDYSLLKGAIESMKWFYLRVSVIVLFLLSTFGTFYLSIILKNYSSDKLYAYIAWIILCLVNAYNLYTFYYDSLLVGRGFIKTSKKIIVLGQIIFIAIASVLLILGFGIVAVVSTQAVYVILVRKLSRRAFYTEDIRKGLSQVTFLERNKVLQAVYPNAIKLGFTVLGGILIQRSAVFIGSLYLPLSEIASYGITRQIFDILSSLAPIFVTTYIPLISQFRVEGKDESIKKICIRGAMIYTLTFLAGSALVYFFGNHGLKLIGSGTMLLNGSVMFIMIVVTFLEMNHSTAGNILLTKNVVPFFIPSLISGIATAAIMIIMLQWTSLGLYSLVLAPLLVDISYQSWKWPLEVVRDLKIRFSDLGLGKIFKRVNFNSVS